MRRFSLPLIPLLAVLMSVTIQAQVNLSAKDYVKRGITRFGKGDTNGALADFDRALELEPDLADAHLLRGKARRAKGNLDGAIEDIEDYEKAIELDPRLTSNNRDITQAFANRGFIRVNQLDLEGAIADFDKAIQVSPSDAESYIKRAEALLIKGNLADAITDFDKGIALNPRNSAASLAYAGRGFTRLLQGDEAEARKDFDKSIKLNVEGRIFLELHLKILETQIKEMKRRRAADQQRVA
jgi:tetratricopeptide (TPR) repeat protein